MGDLSQYRRRPHWSASSLNQFVNICSLQFACDRIYRLRREFVSVSLSFGSAYHRVMEAVAERRMTTGLPGESEVVELWRETWDRQARSDADIRFGDGESPESLEKLGAGMVAAYLKTVDGENRVVAVGQAFAVPLVSDGAVLEKPMIGEIDFIEETRGEEEICDWKTAARRWSRTQADKSLQATVYIGALRILRGTHLGMRFDVATKTAKPVVESHRTRRTAESFDRVVALAAAAERAIAAEAFLPSEQGFYCGSCPHASACRDWHRRSAATHVRMAA
jgi:hypothetical protein